MVNYSQAVIDYIRNGQNMEFGTPKLNPYTVEQLKTLNIECDGYHGYLPIENGGKYLNIGCGFDHRKGYVNIDIDPDMEPDILMQAADLEKTFEPNSIDGIVMIHMFQLLHLWEALDFMKMAFNVLKSNGRLLLQQQNFTRIINAISKYNFMTNENLFMNIMNGLYGLDMKLEQSRYKYPMTQFCWPARSLVAEMTRIGFRNISAVDIEPEDLQPGWKDVLIVGTKEVEG